MGVIGVRVRVVFDIYSYEARGFFCCVDTGFQDRLRSNGYFTSIFATRWVYGSASFAEHSSSVSDSYFYFRMLFPPVFYL